MAGKTNKDMHNTVANLSQVKDALRRLDKKRSKLKSKSHGRAARASSSKRTVAGEGKRTEIPQKAKSSKKQSKLSCQGKKLQACNSKDNLKHENLDTGSENLKRRRRKKRKHNADPDDVSRLQRRTRYLLIKMKLEQNLIDAYSAEGWKGQRGRTPGERRDAISLEREASRACCRGDKKRLSRGDLVTVMNVEEWGIFLITMFRQRNAARGVQNRPAEDGRVNVVEPRALDAKDMQHSFTVRS